MMVLIVSSVMFIIKCMLGMRNVEIVGNVGGLYELNPVEGWLVLQNTEHTFSIRLLRGCRAGAGGAGCSH